MNGIAPGGAQHALRARARGGNRDHLRPAQRQQRPERNRLRQRQIGLAAAERHSIFALAATTDTRAAARTGRLIEAGRQRLPRRPRRGAGGDARGNVGTGRKGNDVSATVAESLLLMRPALSGRRPSAADARAGCHREERAARSPGRTSCPSVPRSSPRHDRAAARAGTAGPTSARHNSR